MWYLSHFVYVSTRGTAEDTNKTQQRHIYMQTSIKSDTHNLSVFYYVLIIIIITGAINRL